MRNTYKNSLVIAITGGIGSGQSTVSSYFQQWQCKVINADLKAKEVIRKNKALQSELKKAFGNSIFTANGKLDNARLAAIAFSNEIKTQKLNQLVHPHMVESLVEDMEKARFSGRYPLIIIDAALIFEISIEQMFDGIIVVDAPLKERMMRVKERDNMTQRQFKERADKQIPLSDKVKWADFVINNDDSLEVLKSRSRKVLNELLKMQKKSAQRKAN